MELLGPGQWGRTGMVEEHLTCGERLRESSGRWFWWLLFHRKQSQTLLSGAQGWEKRNELSLKHRNNLILNQPFFTVGMLEHLNKFKLYRPREVLGSPSVENSQIHGSRDGSTSGQGGWFDILWGSFPSWTTLWLKSGGRSATSISYSSLPHSAFKANSSLPYFVGFFFPKDFTVLCCLS